MIDLIAQVLRHKALKALADIFDPFGKEIVYLFIRHIKERNELLKLLVRKTRDVEIIPAFGGRYQIVFDKVCRFLVGQNILRYQTVFRFFHSAGIKHQAYSVVMINIIVKIFFYPIIIYPQRFADRNITA